MNTSIFKEKFFVKRFVSVTVIVSFIFSLAPVQPAFALRNPQAKGIPTVGRAMGDDMHTVNPIEVVEDISRGRYLSEGTKQLLQDTFGIMPAYLAETLSERLTESARFNKRFRKVLKILGAWPSISEWMKNNRGESRYDDFEKKIRLIGIKPEFDKPGLEIPFEVANDKNSYKLVLSSKDADDIVRGYISGDCTNPSWKFASHTFNKYIPEQLLSPGFLNFKVYRTEPSASPKWIGNVYAVTVSRHNLSILLVDAIQIPWKGLEENHGMQILPLPAPYNGTKPNVPFSVKNLDEAKEIAKSIITVLSSEYAPQYGFKKTYLGFGSNFTPLVEYLYRNHKEDYSHTLYPSDIVKNGGREIGPPLTLPEGMHTLSDSQYHTVREGLNLELIGISDSASLDSFNNRRGFADITPKNKKEYYVDKLDEDGIKTGETIDREIAIRNGTPYPGSAVLIFTPDGRKILLQKRAHWRQLFPDRWTNSVGGGSRPEETPIDTAVRETLEEIGLKADRNRLVLIGKERGYRVFLKVYKINDMIFYQIKENGEIYCQKEIADEELAKIRKEITTGAQEGNRIFFSRGFNTLYTYVLTNEELEKFTSEELKGDEEASESKFDNFDDFVEEYKAHPEAYTDAVDAYFGTPGSVDLIRQAVLTQQLAAEENDRYAAILCPAGYNAREAIADLEAIGFSGRILRSHSPEELEGLRNEYNIAVIVNRLGPEVMENLKRIFSSWEYDGDVLSNVKDTAKGINTWM